ncbi:NAD+ synthase [Aliidiomarina minuta]|uniref:Glutamine-dependent NAD(+) synthetase n=1 Tax=Aliidiomarina minuta TaxID=880057 RepID=A0A432W4Y4_9GAMM|nr:NAD+ synthase [Aliidiomarina minuta]RUO24519.1 NAD+ synthase [Aliidiomarina minuta]
MAAELTIALAQINLTVGAISANTEKVVQLIKEQSDADIIVFPELTLTGYPLEDIVYRSDLYHALEEAIERVIEASQETAVLIGYPETDGKQIYNVVSVFHQGQRLAHYRKQLLPNYSIFDEKRYFTAGEESCVFEFKGHQIGLLICEDLWQPEPIARAKACGAELILSVNASPYEEYKAAQRLQVLHQRSTETNLPVVYVNQVGGQDEFIFDGNSVVLDAAGEARVQLAHCEEEIYNARFEDGVLKDSYQAPQLSAEAALYKALVLALRDYVEKNGFKKLLLGLSGGIDSALTLALAVDAVGADKVRAVMMPYQYTADISVEDARQQAEWLGCQFDIVPVAGMVDSYMQVLPSLTGEKELDTTEENLQARCRGVLLMAISNKEGSLLLSTGNKSELAVGYCTLYGDMCGGFAPVKDVSKGLVYTLSRYRNTLGKAIPERVIERPPSAELAPEQKDEDSLPPYPILDEIIAAYVEQDQSLADMINAGYDEETVRHIVRLIDRNEYKRRQGAVGPKVTSRSFGKERRYPITSHFLYTMLAL